MAETSTGDPPVRVYAAETIEIGTPPWGRSETDRQESEEIASLRSWPVRLWYWIGSGLEWLFGLVSMLVILALVATVPVIQFLSLGYLLECSGRVARTGRVREGFIGIREAARVGSLVLGTWLMLWPLRFLSDLWYSAELMAPNQGPATGMRILLMVTTSLFILHVLLAWYCGGRLRHFFWPVLAIPFLGMWLFRLLVAAGATRPMIRKVVGWISPRLLRDLTTVPPLASWFPPAVLRSAWRRGGLYAQARDAVWDFMANMRIPYFFWLGARGFFGAVAWLVLPALLMIGMTKVPAVMTDAGANLNAIRIVSSLAGLSAFIGAVLMALVVIYLPFLQVQFAAENRLVAIFDVREVRRMFRRAPLAFWMALFITLLFALPPYLLKIEYAPREILAIPSFLFVVLIYPARLLTGWAVARARQREQPRSFVFQWLARLASIPVVGFYVFVLFFTQYVSWDGAWSLLEQHPFLLPAPFFGM